MVNYWIVKHSDTVAKLRLLHVERAARGLGIGTRQVDECIRFSRAAGYEKSTCVAQEPHHRFGKDLVAETWELAL